MLYSILSLEMYWSNHSLKNELRGRLEFVPRFLASGLFGIKNLRTQVFLDIEEGTAECGIL